MNVTYGGSYRPRKLLTLECQSCGEVFQATRPDARYCTANCRKQSSRAMQAIRKTKASLKRSKH